MRKLLLALMVAALPVIAPAQVKISALPASTTPYTGAELTACVQSGVTDQCSLANILSYVLTTPTPASGNALQITMATGKGGTGNGNGGIINITAGDANGTGTGGNVNINAGTGGVTSGIGTGGALAFSSGDGGNTSGSAGGLLVATGNAHGGNGAGGGLNIIAGTSVGTAPGPSVLISGGAGNNGATFGGLITLTGGAQAGGTAANTTISAGSGADAAHTGSVVIQDFNGDNSFAVDAFGNVICACSTLTTATDQFLYLGASAGVPTGVPAHITGVYANSIPVRYDTTDSRLYGYNGAWKNVADSSVVTGTTTNNSAAAGILGEFITATVASGSAVSLTSATTANVTSISLTAGDWDVTCAIDYTIAATTNVSNLKGGISLTSATLGAQAGGSGLGTDPTFSKFYFNFAPGAFTETVPCTTVRVSLASTTTTFLVTQATFSTSTLSAYGTIRARRVR